VKPLSLVGVLNLTPDSFSDGGNFQQLDDAIRHAHKLIEDGADLIDVGGDSTRPGSRCVGAEEELKRIAPFLERLPRDVPFSVDTHHPSVAECAIERGAVMINDVMAGKDPEMFRVMASTEVLYVMMYSRCELDHSFRAEPQEDILERLKRFFGERIECALACGISESQIVLDPGMGKFISDDPENSWRIIREVDALIAFARPVYVGVSRKGFLRLPLEKTIFERDLLTAYIGKLLVETIHSQVPLFLRVHNVRAQREMLAEDNQLSRSLV
jgi:dihydropteroate synthase